MLRIRSRGFRSSSLMDFGLKPLRPPAHEDPRDLFDERYESAATIVTSSLLCGPPHKRLGISIVSARFAGWANSSEAPPAR
jgi:hypothetical protein